MNSEYTFTNLELFINSQKNENEIDFYQSCTDDGDCGCLLIQFGKAVFEDYIYISCGYKIIDIVRKNKVKELVRFDDKTLVFIEYCLNLNDKQEITNYGELKKVLKKFKRSCYG